jgi:hypothetical protein
MAGTLRIVGIHQHDAHTPLCSTMPGCAGGWVGQQSTRRPVVKPLRRCTQQVAPASTAFASSKAGSCKTRWHHAVHSIRQVSRRFNWSWQQGCVLL